MGPYEFLVMEPTRPRRVSELAVACLDALAARGHGRFISLGGAFGLAHYFEYRDTHDVDAWWTEPAGPQDRRAVTETLQEALASYGQVRTRSWGEVVSIELKQGGPAIFSFQIASRSALLQKPQPGPWPGGILVDSLEDLVASKMAALVERGAPRDFRDIYTLCANALCSIEQCWDLWETRQQMAGENADRRRAVLAIETHLARLEQVRPLPGIEDPEQRADAENLRSWFRKEFPGELPD